MQEIPAPAIPFCLSNPWLSDYSPPYSFPKYSNFGSFSAEMSKVFDWAAMGHDTARQLLDLCQRNNCILDFTIEFRALVAYTGLNSLAKYNMFRHGLREAIKDELVT